MSETVGTSQAVERRENSYAFTEMELLNYELRLKVLKNHMEKTCDNSYHTLCAILKELLYHYEKECPTRSDCLSSFYIIKGKTWFPFDLCSDQKIKNLLHGVYDHAFVRFSGTDCKVLLHPTVLSDGLPLILLQHNQEFLVVKHKNITNNHISLFKFQPVLRGMKCKKNIAEQWLKNMNRDYSLRLNHPILSKICALWLGTTVDEFEGNVLIVDGDSIIKFLELLASEEDLYCFFLLSGQHDLFAYIQINDNMNNTLSVLPVGKVMKKQMSQSS